MAVSDPLEVAFQVGRALDQLGVAWFLGGSLASSIQGEPRATNDIDLVADLDEARARQLGPLLGPEYSVDTDELLAAVRARRSSNLFYLPYVTKIDLFVCGASAFDRSELQRRIRLNVRSGCSLWVKSPEDSILRKLVWYRAGGEVSSQQFRDVVGTLRVSAAVLDRTYLGQWAEDLKVEDLLARAESEAAIG
jgi:hypothetical protein